MTETPPPRSRRALLTAAIGASVATLATAVGRPLSARAADGEPVLVGGEYLASSVTKFDTGATASIALWGRSDTEPGVFGSSSSGIGVRGASPFGIGVYGGSGQSAGIVGESGAATGVLGISGGPAPAAPRKTGVYGFAAQDTNARGVHGQSTSGRGVFGQATSGHGVRGVATTGTAGYFATSLPTSGYALRAIGRVRLDRCAGVATIASGTNSIVVTPGIDLVTTSAVVATLQGSAGGRTTVHRVVVDTTANTFTIYLTANSTANVKVAWHVFG